MENTLHLAGDFVGHCHERYGFGAGHRPDRRSRPAGRGTGPRPRPGRTKTSRPNWSAQPAGRRPAAAWPRAARPSLGGMRVCRLGCSVCVQRRTGSLSTSRWTTTSFQNCGSRSRTRASSGPASTEASSARASSSRSPSTASSGSPASSDPGSRAANTSPTRVGRQPASHEPQRLCRRPVEPLLVIDHADQRVLGGHLRQQAEHGQPHEEPVRRRTRGEAERGPRSGPVRAATCFSS